MNDQNPHKDAQVAIRWLQDYFKSLKKWIATVDDFWTQDDRWRGDGWVLFEANRVSTALGNGYRDDTQWVMNWVSRHYFKRGTDRSLLVYLPLASLKSADEVDVYCYLADMEHDQPAPDEGVPSYPKDWIAGAPIVNGLRGTAANTWIILDDASTKAAFRGVREIRAVKVPMTDFGNSVDGVRDKMDQIFSTLESAPIPTQGV